MKNDGKNYLPDPINLTQNPMTFQDQVSPVKSNHLSLKELKIKKCIILGLKKIYIIEFC